MKANLRLNGSSFEDNSAPRRRTQRTTREGAPLYNKSHRDLTWINSLLEILSPFRCLPSIFFLVWTWNRAKNTKHPRTHTHTHIKLNQSTDASEDTQSTPYERKNDNKKNWNFFFTIFFCLVLVLVLGFGGTDTGPLAPPPFSSTNQSWSNNEWIPLVCVCGCVSTRTFRKRERDGLIRLSDIPLGLRESIFFFLGFRVCFFFGSFSVTIFAVCVRDKNLSVTDPCFHQPVPDFLFQKTKQNKRETSSTGLFLFLKNGWVRVYSIIKVHHRVPCPCWSRAPVRVCVCVGVCVSVLMMMTMTMRAC